ncbi:MAG: tetratricopeptide repeat protein, partial [Sedimentisphaerales bacterium]|nr:tetratricopeptide repeat protein [Sedimentisphaerales bacterium]
QSGYEQDQEISLALANAAVNLTIYYVQAGRLEEAEAAFEKGKSLGADFSHLLNTRGEAQRIQGQYELAIADYKEAIKVNAEAVWPHFNIVSSLLGMGRITEALDYLPQALDTDRKSESPKGSGVVQSLQESFQELFEHASERVFGSYLGPAMEIMEREGYLELFEQSLTLTVFVLLKDHEKISEERFGRIIQAFEEVIGKRIPSQVAVLFLKTGVEYFKNKNRKALLKLSREERITFCEQFGIESP